MPPMAPEQPSYGYWIIMGPDPPGIAMAKTHPADEFVQSAHQTMPKADEYLIDADPPTGALIKADNPKIVLEAQKDGKVRLTCRPGRTPRCCRWAK